MYCSSEIEAGSVVDMCHPCMHNVWGEKMTETILASMAKEKEAGNLELGRVGEEAAEKRESKGREPEEPKAREVKEKSSEIRERDENPSVESRNPDSHVEPNLESVEYKEVGKVDNVHSPDFSPKFQ